MAEYYKSYKPRTFDPSSNESFKVSRSKIDFFMDCPRCFYLEARHGVKRPSMPSFTLNLAVDALLKKEFDAHRAKGNAHPLMQKYGLDLVPFKHAQMDEWRENFVGVRTVHKSTNLLVFGAVDDVWVNKKGELFVVDYKATSKDTAVTELENTKWHDQYRRQMEVYQWLLRQNGFTVSDTGYFVYVNGRKDLAAFDAKLEFEVNLIPYTGSDGWVEQALSKLKACLLGELPSISETCEFCVYRKSAQGFEGVEQKAKVSVQVAKASKKARTAPIGEPLF